jgi:hypothetical protein
MIDPFLCEGGPMVMVNNDFETRFVPSARTIVVGCFKVAPVRGVSSQAAFGAGHTLSQRKTLPGER